MFEDQTGAKSPLTQAKNDQKGSKEGPVGSLSPRPYSGRSGLSRGVSSRLGVIIAAWPGLPPASLPRNLVLVYHEELWLLQSPVALLQLPRELMEELKAWEGEPGPGRIDERENHELPGILALPGLPHQDRDRRDSRAFPCQDSSGLSSYGTGKRKNRGAGENEAENGQETRKN